ncbi:hypothetical protein PO472_05625 [Atlantibacter hermannii]|uniref:hypothetical protein n=1 Tax=Atlantibacter hermannii TaxID=565 RepID=UPI002FF72155
MKNTYQMMKALVTLPPVGETINDNAGNTRKYGGEHKVHIAAVDRSWTAQFSYYFDEPILLRELNIQGFSSTPWVVSEKIMVPDGYLIIAMLVDEKGVPLSNEMLPLELEELPRTGWSLNKSGEAHIAGEPDSLQKSTYNLNAGVKTEASELQEVMQVINKLTRAFEAFSVQVGKNFIKEAFIQPGTIHNGSIGGGITTGHNDDFKSQSDDRLMKNAEDLPDSKAFTLKDNAYVFSGSVIASKTCLSDDMRQAVINAVCNSEVFRSLVEQVNAQSAAHASTVISVQKGIEQALNDTIRNALKPGGLLFNCGR